MEVFIHNLPSQGDSSARGLGIQLQPFMRRLGIQDHTWECDKTMNKRYGHVTFLHRTDGERFLAGHGQIDLARGRPKSRLFFLGAAVLCKRSDRQPDPITLRGISMAYEQQANPVHAANSAEAQDDSPTVFDLEELSCGYFAYVDRKLAFFPELDWRQTGKIKFMKKNLIIALEDGKQIRAPLATIVEIIWSRRGTLTLTFSTVPNFLAPASVEDLMADLSTSGNARQVPQQFRRPSLDGEHAKIVGTCLVYHLAVSPIHLDRKMRGLEGKEVLTISRYDLVIPQAIPPELSGGFVHSLGVFRTELQKYTENSLLPFGILFQLQALVYNGYLHPRTVLALMRELRRTVKLDKAAGRKSISADAVKKLFNAIGWPSPHGDPSDFEVSSLLVYLKESENEIQEGFTVRDSLLSSNQNLTQINRVAVTPSRITLHGPEMENKNRILRKFPNHQDHFIRVQFCDENGQDLHYSPKIGFGRIYGRFKEVLRNGLQIAGRTFTFLGWSHSSLRSHSVWFVSPFVDNAGNLQTYFTIIKALGNFDHIFSPARCAARIGQAFSETPFAVPLDENEIFVTQMPDVTSSDGSRVFSDEVGTLSWEVMEAIWNYLPQKKSSPTCFQIRYAGSKGMLALNTNLPEGERQVCIRPSMTKFDSDDMQYLEICDMASWPIPLVLNRQMIKILEDMGVPEQWFFKLQNRALDELRRITANATNTANFLEHQSVATSIKLHKLVRLADRHNFDYRKENFLRKVVETVILRELRLLKHKARIPVKYGITLFGVMDESDSLQEGEVYVTYDSSAKNRRYQPPPEQGEVFVTRSPALHPGDIQRAINVIPPNGHPLKDLANCIVFSSKGSRDLPSQLSGGDLDGDIYNIIWDPDALRPDQAKVQTFDPADYPRTEQVNIGRPVRRDDMADFFVDFMRTDHLGVIATRHMILADQKEGGTLDGQCIALAEMHSTAVDFSKTGIPVELSNLPRSNKLRPDFLAPGPLSYVHGKSEIDLEQYMADPEDGNEDDAEGPSYKYYKSEKVLGKLYRAVDERRVWYEDIRKAVSTRGPSFWDSFLNCVEERQQKLGEVNWTHRKEEARRIRSAYEDAIYAAMTNYSEHPIQPLTELEVVIGYIINKTGVQTHRQRDRSHKLKDEFDRISTWITREIRGNSAIPASGYLTELSALELCLACVYICSLDEADADVSRHTKRRKREYSELESFRLVAASALLQEIEHLERAQVQTGIGGGGFVGVHSGVAASLTEDDDGSREQSHPRVKGGLLSRKH